MAARILVFPNPGSLPRAVEGGRFRNISGASAGRGLPSKCETDMESRASAEGLGCIRGTTFMLALEALAGVGIYAAWHLLRLLH